MNKCIKTQGENKIIMSKNKKKVVFLGGTCNNSTWRDELIPMLNIDYFNPVVDNWTPECQEEEIKQRKICDYVLYVITPKMVGTYSIAEVVDDSNKRPKKTFFCYLKDDGDKKFGEKEIKSLEQVAKMIKSNGATVCKDLKEISEVLI